MPRCRQVSAGCWKKLTPKTNDRPHEGKGRYPEQEPDATEFFRVNRKYPVNIRHVQKIKVLAKGKLSLTLRPETGEEVLIAREKVPAFEAWMGGEGSG